MRWLPAVDYPPSMEGYWEPVTSTINWCEEDYYATVYSAEIVNTLTNLTFFGLGLFGLRSCFKNGHDVAFAVSFGGYLLTAIGSFLFHSTLKYPMQLIDELSMIYTTCLMCYACFSYKASNLFASFLALGLVGLAAFITLYYHYIKDPIFHQVAYAILTAVVLLRSMYIMEVNVRPSLRRKHGIVTKAANSPKAEQDANDRRDETIVRDMWLLIGFGLSVFLGGFGLWNIDNAYCSTLRQWRHDVGLPWGVLSELHGWWHIMTGYGAYCALVWGVWLRHCLNERQDEYRLRIAYGIIPDIVRIDSSKVNGKAANGHAKLTNGSAKKRV